MMTVGIIRGRVIRAIIWRRLAPSMAAASYRLESMPVMAARKMMAFMPAPFQMRMSTRMVGHTSGVAYQLKVSIPRLAMVMFTMP